MSKRVILVTGTPCVGKTTLALKLAAALNGQYINLTELAEKEQLTMGKDPERDTIIIDEAKMFRKLKQVITETDNVNIIIDGHYAAAVTPKNSVTNILVLRRNPAELRQLMQKCGFNQLKLDENIAAEILDVCLVEALREFPKEKICELDTTGKSEDETFKDALAILDGSQRCSVGGIDWLGMLERQGKLDEYLKT